MVRAQAELLEHVAEDLYAGNDITVPFQTEFLIANDVFSAVIAVTPSLSLFSSNQTFQFRSFRKYFFHSANSRRLVIEVTFQAKNL